jgi:elongation factor Ts
MMDAKKALVENDGNFDASVDFLRKKGMAKAAKKSGRVASEGLVFTKTTGSKGVVVEVNSETDFVAKNETFQAFVAKVADIVLETGVTEIETLNAQTYEGSTTIADKLVELISKIGENMSIRRAEVLEVAGGTVNAYVHMGGKIGVLVGLEGTGDKVEEVARHVAMHIAASNPQFMDRASVDPVVLEKEREIYTDQAIASGKPENIVAKIVDGRINKFCEEICLVDQAFVMDTDRKVGQVVEDAGAKLSGYTRFALGEGIEKKEEDFAAEVAKTMAS